MRRHDSNFEADGGIRAYIRARRERGDKVEDIVRSINARETVAADVDRRKPEPIAERTLWHWLNLWEKAQ